MLKKFFAPRGKSRGASHDLTSGSAARSIIFFAIPLILSHIVQSMYNMVDTFFVGRFAGTAELAAVSVCGPIMSTMIVILGGLSSGVTVVIANFRGMDDDQNVSGTVETAMTFYLILSVAVTALGLIFTPAILRAVNTPAEAFEASVGYLRVIFTGTFFLFGFNLVGALQRGLGDSRSSMIYVMISAAVNIVLDMLLVGAFMMGAFGAAVATVIAQGCAFVLGMRQLFTRKGGIAPRRLSFRMEPFKRMMRIGLPTALNEVMVMFAMLVVSAAANSFGVAASAAYGIAGTVSNLAVISDGAMNSAMASFASRNVGAGKPGRARKGLTAALLFSGGVGLALVPLVWIFAPQLTAFFDSSPEVIALTVSYLRVEVFAYVLFALVGPLIGFIRGTGNQMVGVVVGLVAQYGFRVPSALIFPGLMGFPGVAMAVIAGPLSSVLMYGFVVLSGLWKRGMRTLSAR